MRRHLAVLFLLSSLACSSASQGPASTGSRDLLTADEIMASDAKLGTTYDVISRLRPDFLRMRGRMMLNAEATLISVRVNNSPLGTGIEGLREIPANTVLSIAHYNPVDAQQKFGLNNLAGLIDVKLK